MIIKLSIPAFLVNISANKAIKVYQLTCSRSLLSNLFIVSLIQERNSGMYSTDNLFTNLQYWVIILLPCIILLLFMWYYKAILLENLQINLNLNFLYQLCAKLVLRHWTNIRSWMDSWWAILCDLNMWFFKTLAHYNFFTPIAVPFCKSVIQPLYTLDQ